MKKPPKRNLRIIVALVTVIFSQVLYGQKPGWERPAAIPAPMPLNGIARTFIAAESVIRISGESRMLTGMVNPWGPANPARLPGDFYNQNLGLMCRMEWAFEKNTHIPLRIRLGSLESCNRLEGKE